MQREPAVTHSQAAQDQPKGSLHQAAWPDMFTNLQAAYAELTRAQFQLEQRAAEIDELRDLFERVVESMSEALFLLDINGRVIRVNQAAGKLLGQPKEDLIGQPLTDLCGTDEIPATPWQLLQRAPGGALPNLDTDFHTTTGRIPIILSCGLMRDKRGKITGVLVVARDITERKRAEEMLAQQARELARSNAELEQFAYVASHDLQEPLRMITGFTELLATEYQDKLDSNAKEYISYLVDGARRMQQLISDLLMYARVGTRAKPFTPVDINAILETIRLDLQAAIIENEATIHYDHLPIVMGDQTQIKQLFQNLISNAMKFRSEKTVEIHIGARRQEDQWLFWVRDNGIGMEPEYRERIFVIFQRLHGRGEYPGTGIGLSICKKIVEHHGGRIWVESGLGKGSTFYFLLPAVGRA